MTNEAANALELLAGEAEIVAGMGSYVWDLTTQELAWSDNCYRLLGLEPGAVTPTIELFVAHVHPDDRDRFAASAATAMDTGDVPTIEYRLVVARATRRVLSRGRVVRGDDGRRRIVGTIQDLTHRCERELLVDTNARLLAEAQGIAHVGSWVWRPDSGYISWSPELYRIAGQPFDHVPTVESFDRLVHPDDVAELQRVRARSLELMSPIPHEVRIVRPDGGVRTVAMRARAVHDDDGQWFLGVVHDVTERRELESRLQRQQVLEAIGRLASGVAHDFNNLLTVIVANVHMLKCGTNAPPELDDVLHAARAATELTQRLLSLGRTTQAPLAAVDLAEHVGQALPLLSSAAGADIRVRLELGSTPPVMADVRQLDQVLLNLIINARDAMPDGGTIAVRTCACEGTGAYLSVEDDGVGMPETVRARATEPFFTTKGPGAGSGLGLSMVHGAMLNAAGELTIESTSGVGTCVRLRFRAADSVPVKTQRPHSTAADLSGHCVLVVEDEPAVRRITVKLLRDAGADVVDVDGPDAALARIDEPVDMVLCDVSMPGGGGRRVLQGFRETRPDVSFVFMTGYAERAQWLSGYRVLAKPFSPEELTQAVCQILADSRGAAHPR